ncbi:ShlB/FhaC/HecB family hemolysin secretion/activation protein [Leptothoe sp. PORK10 BA2]|uniref:ShlB/FhaC/HecB family hemolysin secretion/activation protein n=1 Tax=Leptothoe sp. PORK10 BA2 TaxID=3110254 RepID=UPI002B218E97|nr:ShlB/FhaC/HecB family hemolysin secretion/activation protein [Leptothoe sp. PORK10 BA2]MEA5463536.1 ShlB/FhaC/HecB family hemolysin secretion/activation protein [Leptothoe sp. PORK10 BA2]
MFSKYLRLWLYALPLSTLCFTLPASAQSTGVDPLTPTLEPPSEEGFERPEIFEPIAPPETLLENQPIPAPPVPGPEIPETVVISGFEFDGSTVFTPTELTEAVKAALGTELPVELSFTELFRVRSAITQLYSDAGYVTSVAIIPPQEFSPEGGTLKVTVIEGGLEAIEVVSPGRLNPDYVRRRLERFTDTPLRLEDLLEGLQLLQLDPLIQRVSAELSAGPQQGTSLLTVTVEETDSNWFDLRADNSRSPSVGTFQQEITYTEANLLGNGEWLSVGLGRTEGLWSADVDYRFFLNPRDGTLEFSAGFTGSEVLEDPFEILEIESDAAFYEVTWRQPLKKTPTETFALGLTASRQGSRSIFLEDFFGEAVSFPTRGADDDGRSRVTALRFFQEWVKQEPQQVLAARSQFSVGLDVLGATSSASPNSEFFTWRGQGQWLSLLAPDTLLILQGDVQLADGALLPLEQFGLGGANTVRGYRQDLLLVDNGVSASAELRLPLYRSPTRRSLLQLTPFIEGGFGWNGGGQQDPDPDALLSAGVGLLWRLDHNLTARLDWGIPLLDGNADGDSLQENGIHFSFNYRAF